jgi:hypothetical protein
MRPSRGMLDAALRTMIDEVLIETRKMSETAVAPAAPRRHLLGIARFFATLYPPCRNESF